MSRTYTIDEQQKWQSQLPKKNISGHVIVRYKQKILMVKPLYKNHFVFPGGIVEEDESPQQAAVRELAEETGVTVSEQQLQFAGISYTPSQNGFPEKLTFSFLYDCQQIPRLALQESEIESAEWVPMNSITEKSGKRRALYSNIQERLNENSFPFYSDLVITP